MKYNACTHWSSWKKKKRATRDRIQWSNSKRGCFKGTRKSPQVLPSVRHIGPFHFVSLWTLKKLKIHLALLFPAIFPLFFISRFKKTCLRDYKPYSDIINHNMIEWQLARHKKNLAHQCHRIQIIQPPKFTHLFSCQHPPYPLLEWRQKSYLVHASNNCAPTTKSLLKSHPRKWKRMDSSILLDLCHDYVDKQNCYALNACSTRCPWEGAGQPVPPCCSDPLLHA